MRSNISDAGDHGGWPQAILFDLDGTLIDSAPDLASSVNEVLAEDGLEARTVDEIRSMIGNGVKKLVERAYRAAGQSIDGATLDQKTEAMMAIYGGRLTAETVLMPGAGEIVPAFAQAGIKLAVVTNKPEAATRGILDHFGYGETFAMVVGGDTGPARKPSPDGIFHALEKMGVKANGALMVGDSPADIDAAKAADITSIAVRGGYTNVPVEELGADIVINNLAEVPVAIKTLLKPQNA